MTEEKSPLFQIKDIGKILNVADGIAKATQYIEMLDFEQGIKIYESLLNEHENDTLLLDSYAEFLLSIDDQEKAFQVYNIYIYIYSFWRNPLNCNQRRTGGST